MSVRRMTFTHRQSGRKVKQRTCSKRWRCPCGKWVEKGDTVFELLGVRACRHCMARVAASKPK